MGNHRGGRGGQRGREPQRRCLRRDLDDENGPPDFQLLFFPVTDVSTTHASYRLFSDGYFLTEKQMDWYIGHYLPNPSDRTDPRASPLLGDPTDTRLRTLRSPVSTSFVTKASLTRRAAGCGRTHIAAARGGHIHAFVNATGVGKWSKRALAEAVAALSAGMRRRANGASRESTESHGGHAGVSRTPGFRGGKVFVGRGRKVFD